MTEDHPIPQFTRTRYCPDCGHTWESLYAVPTLPGTVPEQPCPTCWYVQQEEEHEDR